MYTLGAVQTHQAKPALFEIGVTSKEDVDKLMKDKKINLIDSSLMDNLMTNPPDGVVGPTVALDNAIHNHVTDPPQVKGSDVHCRNPKHQELWRENRKFYASNGKVYDVVVVCCQGISDHDGVDEGFLDNETGHVAIYTTYPVYIGYNIVTNANHDLLVGPSTRLVTHSGALGYHAKGLTGRTMDMKNELKRLDETIFDEPHPIMDAISGAFTAMGDAMDAGMSSLGNMMDMFNGKNPSTKDCKVISSIAGGSMKKYTKDGVECQIRDCLAELAAKMGLDPSIMDTFKKIDTDGLLSNILNKTAKISIDKGLDGLLDSVKDMATGAGVDLTKTLVDGVSSSVGVGQLPIMHSCLGSIDPNLVAGGAVKALKGAVTQDNVADMIFNHKGGAALRGIQSNLGLSSSDILGDDHNGMSVTNIKRVTSLVSNYSINTMMGPPEPKKVKQLLKANEVLKKNMEFKADGIDMDVKPPLRLNPHILTNPTPTPGQSYEMMA